MFNNEGNEAYSKEDNSNALYFHTEGIKVNCKDEEPLAELYGNRAEKTTFKCSKFTGILKYVCLRLSRKGYSRLSINGHLYKTDTSVKRTLSAGPKGVRLRESSLYMPCSTFQMFFCRHDYHNNI